MTIVAGEVIMAKSRIGVIVSSTRSRRFADIPAQWLWQIVSRRDDAEFELIDLRDYPMPFFEEKLSPMYGPPENEAALRWGAKIASLDGYIFITAEYNHGVTAVLKNALDYAYMEYNCKPAAFVGYGGAGGARAIEQLRLVLAELQVASLKHTVHIGAGEMIGIVRQGKSMADYPYLADSTAPMLNEIVWWSDATSCQHSLESIA
jgi:NAD(P)H-dependent FMN reductase